MKSPLSITAALAATVTIIIIFFNSACAQSSCKMDFECASGLCDLNGVCCDSLNLCNDVCVDTQTDAANCGACGLACAPTENCVSGSCI